MTLTALPSLSDNSLSQYVNKIKKFPMLSEEEEYELAERYAEKEDVAAAHKLVTSHLRLVVKIAMGFRGYGLPIADLVSEGNIGLMQAVKKFDRFKGFRLSTYALWWIKASINEYILRSWSLVKIGTTASQKKLFFNLRKLKHKIFGGEDRELRIDDVKIISNDLNVSEKEVVDMDSRLRLSDASLDAKVGDEDGTATFGDFVEDKSQNIEYETIKQDEKEKRVAILQSAMKNLNEREIYILQKRQLAEDPETLEILSKHFGVSRERIRQIESRAIEKLRKEMVPVVSAIAS